MNERMAVKRRCRVPAVALPMLQEVADHGRVEILEAELARRFPESTADVSTQELEGVAVTGDGVLADAFLHGEMVPEEGGDEVGERGRWSPPFTVLAVLRDPGEERWVASRYQCCSARRCAGEVVRATMGEMPVWSSGLFVRAWFAK
jgi:hypothetical protein